MGRRKEKLQKLTLSPLWDELSDPTEIAPLSRDACRTTVSSVASQTVAAAPPLSFRPDMAHCSPETGLGGVLQKKLASEAYCAIGGIA